MRVLITGGAGFIGSHLADALLERGDEVFILDDLSTGSIDNIGHLRSKPKFHYTIESVHHGPTVAELVDQCDVVFHLAAAVGVRLIVESPVRTIETNVHGTEVVLAKANKKTATWCWARPPRGAGATRARRRSTSFWRLPTGASASCPR
jgi:UDP-glucose 4-epimerase